MSIKYLAQLSLALLLVATSWIVLAVPARAQADVSGQIIKDVQFEQKDVRQAIRELFKSVGVSYSIAPEVQGTITVALHNVTFEVALQNVLRQVDATYRIEGGVYEVVHQSGNFGDPVPPELQVPIRPEATQSPASALTEPRAETAITQDSRFLYIVRGDALYKVQKSDLKLVKTGALDKVDIHIALRKLFERMNVLFTVAQDVQGAVTVGLPDAPFETALQDMLRQINATYRVQAGVYEIVHRILPKGAGSGTPWE